MEKIEKLTKSKTFKNEKIIERKEKKKKEVQEKMRINFYRIGKMKKKVNK